MTQPVPPPREPQDIEKPRETDTPESAADQRRGVLQQRQHIKDLDGEDPLRGGVAD